MELRKALSLLLILCFVVALIPEIEVTKASAVNGPIRIWPDEIEGTDKIQQNGRIYTFTDDINGDVGSGLDAGFSPKSYLVINRPNIIIDGAGHTIRGSGRGYGINVKQNNVTIKNLNIENFHVGITFFGKTYPSQLPRNHKILNNSITVVYSDDVTQRDITGFGIYVKHAKDTIFSGNTITTPKPEKGGIYLGNGCYNNNIVNNKLIGCALDIYSPGANTILNNTIDGKPIVQFNSVSNQVIDDAEQVLLFDCTNMTITNIHPAANYRYAIHLDQTRNSQVTNCEGHIFLRDSNNNTIYNNYPKTIEFTGCNYNQIFENNITGADVSMTFQSSDYNDIYGNCLSNNHVGLQFAYPGDCNYNRIYENRFSNDHVGIEIDYSANNSIYDNNIADCYEGISLGDSDQNRIYQNDISKCRIAVGIRADNNTVYNNNFIENEKQVSISPTYLFSSSIIIGYSTNNTFDSGYPLGGNYWSDYNGTDADGDGIGDTPYIIDKDNQDNYPLMDPTEIPEFSSWIILPLLLSVTLFAVITKRKAVHSTHNSS